MVAVIIILAVAVGVMYFQSMNVSEQSIVKITSDNALYEGNDLSVELSDLNKTPISDADIDIVIKDKDGDIVVNGMVKTDSKGKAKLNLDLSKGKYDVEAIFNGNDNFTLSNATQKLTIEEVKTETVSSNDYPEYSADLGYYRSTGITDGEFAVVELASGRQVVIAGDGYYEYNGKDAQGYIITGTFLGHGGQSIAG
ncbi:hypothetical protein [uncultured Methanobrevibacter sp.]|uniref:hypothetical protein n=1 Tax=uncultured Methanobrevibacter sp. TaxID=253161 RepID=UPI0025E3604C|nr:hypothetical protein [uncultured Methanobrevibacter sp.]MCI6993542.1 hypothetical protein [Methanobrevibacter sp.]